MRSSYTIQLGVEIGTHVFPPSDLATHRYSFDAEQQFVFTPAWSFKAGMHSAADVAYVTNSRYIGGVVKDESYELNPRDIYLQYQQGPYLLRFGNQQVVWGEAFGFFYADIINPKDLRKFVPQDLDTARISVPMVNLKVIGATSSLQLLYIPYPYFHRMPNPGSDYFPLSAPLPAVNFTLNDTRTPPFELRRGEVGLRATQLVSGVDLSLFYFSYLDRGPNFQSTLTSVSPTTVTLDAYHHRVQTLGLTATMDFDEVLTRVEALYTGNRYFDTLSGTTVRSVPSDEAVVVLEADYTGLPDWRLGAQIAIDKVLTEIPNKILPYQTMVSLHANRALPREQSIDALLSFAPEDQSALLRLEFVSPLTSALEMRLGADFFLGANTSQFGFMHDASRVVAGLRAFLGN